MALVLIIVEGQLYLVRISILIYIQAFAMLTKRYQFQENRNPTSMCGHFCPPSSTMTFSIKFQASSILYIDP